MNASEKRMIEKFYRRLYRLTESSRDFENLTDMVRKEEREHRAMGKIFTDGQCRYNAPLGATAEYFAVKYVFDGLTSSYTAENFLYVRHSCLIGAGIASKYRAAIVNEFTQVEIVEFSNLDYCELIK